MQTPVYYPDIFKAENNGGRSSLEAWLAG